MTTDPTEDARRSLIPTMPAELAARVEAGEQIWDTKSMQVDFEALGFLAPFIVVRRRADGVKGTLMFDHSPRWYFGFEPES